MTSTGKFVYIYIYTYLHLRIVQPLIDIIGLRKNPEVFRYGATSVAKDKVCPKLCLSMGMLIKAGGWDLRNCFCFEMISKRNSQHL